MIEELVRVTNVEKSYWAGEVEFPALHGVSLSVKKGEFTALVGSSGSGKSTLLNLIGCLDQPTRGDVVVAGQSLKGLSENQQAHFRSASLGFIFQSYNLFPVLNVIENVSYPLLKVKGDRAEQKREALALLEQVGLGGFASRRVNQLSGGQRQRVAVARALIHRPRLVLADEPTANLDQKTAQDMISLMVDLNQKLGVTFIFSTHDPTVMKMARRKVFLSDGKIQREEQ